MHACILFGVHTRQLTEYKQLYVEDKDKQHKGIRIDLLIRLHVQRKEGKIEREGVRVIGNAFFSGLNLKVIARAQHINKTYSVIR